MMKAEPLYRQRLPRPEFQELETLPYITRQEKLLPIAQTMGGPSPSASVVPPPTVPMRAAPMGVR
jgi:hypothetical protein